MWIRRIARTLVAALAVAAAGLAGGPGAADAAEDVFTVRDVSVDVTAETAAAAREAAHAEGHVKAMAILLERLLQRGDVARLRALKPSEVIEYVHDFEVANERTSDVRYLADMTFRFKPDAVRQLLRANGLAYAETRSKPVLVLPVYGPVDTAILWDEGNAWLQTWAARRSGDWLVPLVVPLGDLADIAGIDAAQALDGDMERLSALARRYGADDVLVTQAVLSDDPLRGPPTLQVGTSRLGMQQRQTVIDNFAQGPDETLEALLARAADEIAAQVQEEWKARNLLLPGDQRRITVTVPVASLGDWLEVQRRLGSVAQVERSEVTLLSRSKTEVDITFVGSEQQLVLAMSQSDLTLTFDPTSGWQLFPAGGGEPRAAAPEPLAGTGGEPPPGTGAAAPEPSAPASE